MWSTACMYECSLIYKLSGLNLPSQWPFLGYSMFTVTSLKKYWISKKKSQVNMYREPCDQTVNPHLAVGWGWAISLFTWT